MSSENEQVMKKIDQIKKEYKFTKDTPIIEIAELFPNVAEYLLEEYGFHCIGCPLSFMETLGEGVVVHGLTPEETDKLIEELNQMIKEG